MDNLEENLDEVKGEARTEQMISPPHNFTPVQQM